MKIKELKELLANAGDNDNIEVVNNKITFIKDKPQPITERIKTLDDACLWCENNGKQNLTEVWCNTDFEDDADTKDIAAYLKLRIIACALNEGWEPTEEDFRYASNYSKRSGEIDTFRISDYYCDASINLCFKNEDLAAYAAKQFRDIYADFCGCKKGGEG